MGPKVSVGLEKEIQPLTVWRSVWKAPERMGVNSSCFIQCLKDYLGGVLFQSFLPTKPLNYAWWENKRTPGPWNLLVPVRNEGRSELLEQAQMN